MCVSDGIHADFLFVSLAPCKCCPLRVLLHVNEGCKRVYWQGDRMPDAAAGIMLSVIGYIIRNLWGVEDESAGYVRGSFWGI